MKSVDVDIREVTKRFAARAAVESVTLAVEGGEFLTLLGPSGCGKTTLLRLVAGFEMPDEGRILLGGVDVSETPAHRRDVHTVFQQYALFPHLNVGENIAFGLRRKKIPRGEIADRVARGLDLVSLPGYERRLPSQLSGGEQQRVAIARAIVLEPRVLLLDEPLSALDRKLRERMQLELKALQRQLGISFLFVTHDQDEALAMSDRIAVMRSGRIEQLGTPRDIYERPQTEFVAGFVGISNILGGRVVEAAGGGRLLDAPGARIPLHHSTVAGGEVRLAVRPERIRIVGPGDENALPATVESAVYRGDVTHWLVRLEDGSPWTVAEHKASGTLASGSRVGLAWEPEHGVLLNQSL